MANGNIGDVPASTFAEYVQRASPSSPELPTCPGSDAADGASGSASTSENEAVSSDAEPHAPPQRVSQFTAEAAAAYAGLRPPLAHRLYSHRLHVRAKAKLQRDRLLSGPLVDVYVGDAKRHWSLHRNLLCHHSELLESELQSGGKKQPDRLDLMEYDAAGFELLVKWMYQGRLDDVSDMADPTQKYEYAVSCHKLYLLCDRFDMPQLKNVAMDQYRKGLHEAQLVPDAEEINDIYRKSPAGSPFRRLMTQIAARQIMDPDSDRDVETYRECFVDNPEFAVGLVTAIKLGTGGMLFEDPTSGGGCEFHDHEAGPNCHIKGKGRAKQALHRDPISAKSAPSASPDPRPLHRPPPPITPTPRPPPPQNLPHPPRQARPQDGGSAGPLRRRLTSPASSTLEMSIEHATASPPSPKELRDKFRRTTPGKNRESPVAEEVSQPLLTAQDVLLQSFEGEARPLPGMPPDKTLGDTSCKVNGTAPVQEDPSPRRGLWEWARSGTGRLGLSRIPHPEWRGPMSSKAATTVVNGVLGGGRSVGETRDDFSIPSATSTEPENEARKEEAAAARLEGLGLANNMIDSMFSQTKRSSDDLVAEASTTTSPDLVRDEVNPPSTPSPPERKKPSDDSGSTTPSSMKKALNETPDTTPSPRQIPKYKIALAGSLLSPRRQTSVS
ncbi:hypothetical protein BCR34DRAFT_475953 [Clohesyomyces aquaticus]|uniref:BTB domain-containing protein n=1 Tax=Clohesyomyces aquaticus TaxID=1231657 RepID=A0A1Y2A2S3_9PLEO|nr:hypothetical protein BCR34DRAFT_475953 [Clohesyomyces aquaticus]